MISFTIYFSPLPPVSHFMNSNSTISPTLRTTVKTHCCSISYNGPLLHRLCPSSCSTFCYNSLTLHSIILLVTKILRFLIYQDNLYTQTFRSSSISRPRPPSFSGTIPPNYSLNQTIIFSKFRHTNCTTLYQCSLFFLVVGMSLCHPTPFGSWTLP